MAVSSFIDLRRGEGSLATKSAVALFALIAAHTLLETARDALFLGELPPSRLALVYVLVAAVALVVSKWNTSFVRSFGRRNALIFTLLITAYGTTVLYLLPLTPTVVFGLYVWSALIGTVVMVQFWMLAGQLFTVAQGKRLFGPIAAGGVFGAVVGAALAILLLRVMSVSTLLLVASGVFLITGLFLTAIDADLGTSAPQRQLSGSLVRLLREEPYLWRLLLLVMISTAAVLTTDYLFKSVAARTIAKEELGIFFAQFYAVLNSLGLLMQLLLAGYLVRRAGVVIAFMVLPLLLLTGGIGILFGGAFFVVLLTKGADGSLRHSLHRITSELLWMPLPDHLRTVAKSSVDTVVVRAVQAAVAGGIFLLATLTLDTPEVLGGVIVGLSGLWIAITLGMRSRYLNLFRQALRGEEMQDLELDLNSVEIVVEALSNREPARVIAAIDLLDASGRARLIPALILYHESDEVLIHALRVIGDERRKDWVPLAERLLLSENEEVRIAALKALSTNGFTDHLEGRLLDVSPNVRARAAFWLNQNQTGSTDITQDSRVQQILSMDGEAGRSAKLGLLEAIRMGGDQRWSSVLLSLAGSDDPEIAEAAAFAMTTVRDERFIPLLIERLGQREGRPIVRRAIAALGEPALTQLEQRLTDQTVDPRVRRHMPRTIAQFGSQKAVDILLANLATEESGHVRFKTLKGLQDLVSPYSHALLPHARPVIIDQVVEERLKLNLLEHLRMMAFSVQIAAGLEANEQGEDSGELLLSFLADKQDQAFDRAFRLLAIAHRNEDIRSVRHALRSPDRRARAQALEFLDTLTLDSKIVRIRDLVRIVADDLSDDERVQRARLDGIPKTYPEAIAMLLEEEDESLAGIAAYHGLEVDALKDVVASAAAERPMLSRVRTPSSITEAQPV